MHPEVPVRGSTKREIFPEEVATAIIDSYSLVIQLNKPSS